jgi:hypothetical protein
MVLLTHGVGGTPEERPPGWPIEEEERIFHELHDELAALVPGTRHIVAEGVGHNIHQDQPDLVVEAILDVVAAVRDPATWATPVASPVAHTYQATSGALAAAA